MPTIDLNHLRSFVAVADTESFSSAARRLGLPKSSISRAIARLEDDLGVRLFHRTTRRVSLSTAGAALLGEIRPELAALERALGEVPEREEQPSGHLKVAAPVDYGVFVVAELASRFVARYPHVSVEVRLSNQLVDLVEGGFDLALRISTGRLADSSLSARKAGPITMQMYAAPTYLARRGAPRSPDDLAGHEWVLFRTATPIRLEGPSGASSVTPRGRLIGDEMSFVREAARAGAGIAALPTFLAEADVAAGQLAPVLPRWTLRSGTLWIVSPSARKVPRKVAAFAALALEVAAGRLR